MATPAIITSAAIRIVTTFELDVTPKQFLFTDITPYAANNIPLTGVRGVFNITSPSGVVISNNTSYGSGSDIVANISNDNAIVIQLPNEQGTYLVTYTVQINDGTNPVYYLSKSYTYNFKYTSPKVCIVYQIDCIQPLLTASDTTNYIVNGLTPAPASTITLDYPANSGGTPIVNTTSSSIVTSDFYTGLQSVTVSTFLFYTAGVDFYIEDTVVGTKSINVDCTFICQLYCCLKSLNNRVESARGVNDILFEELSSQYSDVMAKVELLFLAIDCGKQQDANDLIGKIKILSNCTDDCNCTDGTPSKIKGLGNVNNVNVTVSGSSPITVTPTISGGVTNYAITFSSALVTQLSGMYNTVVVATDSTVTVTSSGVISGINTYSVKANYVVENRMEFQCRIQYTAANGVTITPQNYLYSGTNINSTVIVANTSIATPNANNKFYVSGFQVTPNITYKVDLEPYINYFHAIPSSTQVLIQLFSCGSGAFYFVFTDINGNLFTNSAMFTNGYTDITVNIKISE